MKGYKTIFSLSLALMLLVVFSMPALALTGKELGMYKEKAIIAPDFTLKDLEGKTHKLSDYRGNIIVLETGSST
jgi:hypothetical protein